MYCPTAREIQAYDAVPFFPDVDLSIRVLGFWFVWLFTVPSLRARKPSAEEKEALNIAFLATPLVNFAMPFITKVRDSESKAWVWSSFTRDIRPGTLG